MTKNDIINEIYINLKTVKKKDIIIIIREAVKIISTFLLKGNNVYLRGVGTFKIRLHKEYKKINPQNKQPIIIPPQKVIKFIPSKKLKNIL